MIEAALGRLQNLARQADIQSRDTAQSQTYRDLKGYEASVIRKCYHAIADLQIEECRREKEDREKDHEQKAQSNSKV